METPNEKVADKITLTKVNTYAAIHEDEDGRMTGVSYFKEPGAATIKSKGIGAWGRDGKVELAIMHIDDQGNLYGVQLIGPFVDVSEAERDAMLEGIKAKLSPAEWEFIQQNSKEG